MKITTLFLLLLATASLALATQPEPFEISLDSNPTQYITAQRDMAAHLSDKHTSKFRILPGLTNANFVSFEPVGAKGYFLRHKNFVLLLNQQPKQDGLFAADASFKKIEVGPDKVRFESTNYPGMFITAKEDGTLIILANPPVEKSTFDLKPAGSQ